MIHKTQHKLIPTFLLMAFVLAIGFTVSTSANAQFFSNKTQELLPEDEAFSVTANVSDEGLLRVNWSIADDYYMYRDQFSVEAISDNVSVGNLSFPEGVVEDDPEFGEVVVYFYNVELTTQLLIESGNFNSKAIELVVKGQGCNKPVGVCYPPLSHTLSVDLSAAAITALNQQSTGEGLDKDGRDINRSKLEDADRTGDGKGQETLAEKEDKTFSAYVISAFLAGILLSFTPCVLPMIPILAGVIAGQQNPSKIRSGWLAICYVAGTVVTYILAGAIAGATGAQLQAYFQNVWVIVSICGLLVLLAASLFGWFKIQLPSSIQSKLNGGRVDGKSVSFSSFVLGLISALVVGACVSPILILALGAAITQGDPILGASIMGSMAIGMGLLLILFGFGAGWILPKAGAWMTEVQIVFGFMVLGVAIYLLSGLAFIPSLYLWAALLLCGGFYCWQLANDVSQKLISSAIRAASAGLIIWGAMALIGGSHKGDDILQPLSSITFNQSTASDSTNQIAKLPLTTVTSLQEVEVLLQKAKEDKKPVLIDFYADWCLDCKRMHRTTFKSPSVLAALDNWSFIEIDVTDTSDKSEEVKRHFNVFGPPATLFVDSNGLEQKNLRQYGYIKEDAFLKLIAQVN